jgi:hypothetical protein
MAIGYPERSSLPGGFRLTQYHPDNAWVMSQVIPEYLTVSSPEIAASKRRSPARSIRPNQLQGVLQDKPFASVGMSIRTKSGGNRDNRAMPMGGLLFLDVEYFNKLQPGLPLQRMEDMYRYLEPVYQEFGGLLTEKGINFASVLSGRGYHFFSYVPQGKVLNQIREIGKQVEPQVVMRHVHGHQYSKQPRGSLPIEVEQVYRGGMILQQYLFNLAMQRVRERNASYPVSFSDTGNEGVAFDNTGLGGHSGNRVVESPGCLYIKPQLFPHKFGGPQVVDETRVLVRIYRSNRGQEYAVDLGRYIQARQDNHLAKDNMVSMAGNMPDGSKGISRLIREYHQSELQKLQHDMEDYTAPSSSNAWFDFDMREAYARDASGNLRQWIEHPNDALLKPDNLNYMVNFLVHDLNWRPIDVVNLLRSVYERGDVGFEHSFERHDVKMRRAWGWVFIILSQGLDRDWKKM